MNSDFVVAVHAMAFLHHEGQTVSSEVLAENACTHPARVRRVMAKLRKAGLVETREGRTQGGYSYQKIKSVTLEDISEALEVSFCDFNWRSGDRRQECLVSSGMSDYIDMLHEKLDQRCKESLQSITVADVEHWLKNRKEGLK